MTRYGPHDLVLTEHQTLELRGDELAYEVGESLHERFGKYLDVEFPSPRTAHRWRLTSRSWVGQIPMDEHRRLVLAPKVPIRSVFGMLDYAYGLKSLAFGEDLVACESLPDLYETLAGLLARRILHRGRRGFHKDYLNFHERLPLVRGRLDLTRAISRPWDPGLPCAFQEQTPDILDNQILGWTMSVVARSGICGPRVQPAVQRAYRSLQGLTSLVPVIGNDCSGRRYNRLNEDYAPLHSLCRFFLDHSGPSHQMGDREMLPFVLNMARLFELFVVEWLKAHLPRQYAVKAQEKMAFGSDRDLTFSIDIVIYDRQSRVPRCVIDTKYKRSPQPSSADVQQAVAYAASKRCTDAFLLYPSEVTAPFDAQVGDHRVRGAVFSLDGDLEVAGKRFWKSLGL